jgi:RimJ/RimL family protein N-acetyltransferase
LHAYPSAHGVASCSGSIVAPVAEDQRANNAGFAGVAMTGRLPPSPSLTDGTVVLRAFTLEDVPAVTVACQDPEISRWTVSIPFPYGEEDARSWIATHPESWARGTAADFAVTAHDDGRLLGSLGFLRLDWTLATAGVGYWVAAPERRRGVATRALNLGAKWALATVGLDQLDLVTMIGNVASERVAERAGFSVVEEIEEYEHVLDPTRRHHVKRWVRRR